MESGLLWENHPLYKKIIGEQPIWWKLVNKDKDFYIEIRKDNIIDVYYRGGRVAQITAKKNVFEATAHPKYTDDNVTKDNPKYYRKSKSKKGNITYTAIYQNCMSLISTEEGLVIMKERIKNNYATEDTDDVENTSEKSIQGKLIVENRNLYLDSEFAYKLFAQARSRKTVRFDLVKIEDNKLVFVELKRFWDSRMRTSKGNPEIIEQMTNYKNFIEENKEVLLSYYKTLYKIKAKLGIAVPQIDNIEKLSLDPNPQLLVVMCHEDSKHGKNARKDRENYIKAKLGKINIEPQFRDI
jgi:hypothetical protein